LRRYHKACWKSWRWVCSYSWNKKNSKRWRRFWFSWQSPWRLLKSPICNFAWPTGKMALWHNRCTEENWREWSKSSQKSEANRT